MKRKDLESALTCHVTVRLMTVRGLGLQGKALC